MFGYMIDDAHVDDNGFDMIKLKQKKMNFVASVCEMDVIIISLFTSLHYHPAQISSSIVIIVIINCLCCLCCCYCYCCDFQRSFIIQSNYLFTTKHLLLLFFVIKALLSRGV